jgi:DNA-binding PadR family transcriptional regulator
MNRHSRERRRRGVVVRLTERDELLLEAVQRFRLARTGDLVTAAFPGVHPMTASVRLRRLFDAGYLDVRCGDRSEENVYSLGPLGRRWVLERALPVGRIPRGGTAHHLAIVRAWSSVADTLQRQASTALELARADWELREEFGQHGLAVVPDLFLVLRVAFAGERERVVAVTVEVDLGTEALGVLRRKFETYDELADGGRGLFGHREFAVAVALDNPGRGDAVKRLLDRAWHGRQLIWVLDGGPGPALEQFIADLRSDIEPPVTDSRYRNGRSEAASPLASIVKPRTKEGL